MTGEIIKFPGSPCCSDCGKPLDPDEGVVCPAEGCDVRGCWLCSDMSAYCLEHIHLNREAAP